jgi:CRISPR-associated protein Csd1
VILQALCHLYESLAARGLVEEPGWTGSKISFALNLGDNGRFRDVFTLRDTEKGNKPSIMKTPMAVKRAANIHPNFLFDNTSYILGIDLKGRPERTRECFEACRALHLNVLKDVDTPAARAIKAYFSIWNPDAARNEPILKDYLEDMRAGVNLIFYYGGKSAVEDKKIRNAWQNRYDGGEGEKIRCLVTGEMAKLARIHPAIKGVRGGQSSGTALVSFNAPSFESFGREQGMNAPIGERAAFAYTTALNYLIADRDHQLTMGTRLF